MTEKRCNNSIVDTCATLKNELTELNLITKNHLISKIENTYSQLKLDLSDKIESTNNSTLVKLDEQ